MKKNNSLPIIILILMLTLAGCSNSDETIKKDNSPTVEIDKEEAEEEAEAIETEQIKEEEIPPDLQSATAKKPSDEDSPQENETEIISEPAKIDKIDEIDEDKTDEVNNSAGTNENIKKDYTLKIEGLAENSLSLSRDELKTFEDLIFESDFYSLNSFGTTGYTHFKGVNLWSLLQSKALISDVAQKISVVAHDGYKMEFTVEQVKKQDYIDETNPEAKFPMIIAWEENGEEYSEEDEAPFKLVVGQKEAGDVNKPQWVSNIDKIVIE